VDEVEDRKLCLFRRTEYISTLSDVLPNTYGV